jgi:UDP-N-acetylmuramoyl-L-alanyl-D-glutamate--2,6-diaminopimelate ligase
MTLGDLLGNDDAAEVTGFAIDHRKVAAGTVFGAFKGARFNGEDFIAHAVSAGAVAVVARPQVKIKGASHIASDEPRRAFALLAARYYAPFPPTVVAVTGTNGKTSTVELTRQLWRMAGHRAASIGTLGVTTADEAVTTGLTSPDIVTFLSNMAGLQREGITHVAYEASSHGLHQYRAEGMPVKAAAFTNLSRDHLDYHGDMPSYLTAKLRLFSEVVAEDGAAIIYLGDEYADRVVDLARARALTLITVGPKGRSLKLVGRATSTLGQILDIETRAGERHTVNLPLIGAYQAANALTAAALVIATGGDTATTIANLARVQPVRGRLERACLSKAGAAIYIDYAHTPDALAAALEALRPHTAGRLILVFGAGGDRDSGKRPLMGEVAAKGADYVIVTDDNPRTENPAAIRAAVLDKAPGAVEIGDRRAAISAAIGMATGADVVLIAGKGHETGQQLADRLLPFDDVLVAREEAA